ncbi:MAG: SDR family oxidoreductase [Alphaproteobacteria bacterium]
MTETAKPGNVLVTGAARRIGRAIALDFAEAGWGVAVHYDTSEAEARAVTEEAIATGARAVVLKCDLADEAAVDALIGRAADALGPLNCLVNNAARFDYDSADSVTRESWDAHMEANLRAPFVLTQNFAAALPEAATGNVINLLDQRVWNLTPHFISYTLSKAGLWTLTRTLALALAPRIRVNAIGPGPTLPSARQTEAQFQHQAESTPLGRAATPEEICAAIRFILAAPTMTGQMIGLDGGQHLGWASAGPADIGPE